MRKRKKQPVENGWTFENSMHTTSGIPAPSKPRALILLIQFHQLQIKHSYLWAYVSNSLSSHHSHSKSHSHKSLDFSPLSVNIYWHILSLLTHVLWLVYSFPKSTMDGDLNPSNFEPCIWGLWCPSTVLSLLNQWIKPILN